MKINYKYGYLKIYSDVFSSLGAMSYLMVYHNGIFTQIFPKIKKSFEQLNKIQVKKILGILNWGGNYIVFTGLTSNKMKSIHSCNL